MAISDSYNFSITRSNAIQEALELIGEYIPGESISNADIASCSRTLNMMIKAWQSEGISLWKNDECALFFEEDGYDYDIGPSGDHATTDYVKTEVATAASSTDTSLVIDATTGMTDNFDRDGIYESATPAAASTLTLDGDLVSGNTATLTSEREILIYSDGDDSGVTFTVTGTDEAGDTVTEAITGPDTTTVYSTNTYKTVTSVAISGAGTGNVEIGCVGQHLGIELDDGSLQWTWIGAALSTTLTLVDALTDDVAVDNHVYAYTAKLQRPLMITEARLHRSDDTEVPLMEVSREEYMGLSTKTSSGTPNQFYYDPQTTNGKLKIWQASSKVNEWMTFTARVPVSDMDAESDDFDFPPEWGLPICYNLAWLVSPKFGATISNDIRMLALESKKALSDADRELNSVFLEVDIDR